MCFKNFKFLNFDYKKLNVLYLVKDYNLTLGINGAYKVCILSGISIFSNLNFKSLPESCVRCINFSLSNPFFLNKSTVIFERNRVVSAEKSYIPLKDMLKRARLPCNGQRTRTNGKTVKNLRKK